MSLRYGILELLRYSPQSGYELVWVESERVSGDKRPDRRVYHILPQGAQAFQDLGCSYFLVMTPEACRLAEDSEVLKAQCIITTDFATWAAISRGDLDGTEALMSGRYKAKGDTSLMMRMAGG
jgi:DNA-binding PadR family transcriptional regulator